MTEAHTTRAHAKLAPSSAHRWMECPGSIRMSAGFPNESSVFAAEGTAAHELASHCLETGDAPGTFLDMWVDIKASEQGKRFVNLEDWPTEENRFFQVDEEMVESVEMYLDHIKSLVKQAKGEVLVEAEQRLDMTHLHPSIFGTGDATVLDMDAHHLHVCDFKYGRGVVVDADENPQLILYAAGAARRHHNHAIEKLTVHIVQPRAAHEKGPIRSFELDLLDLYEFEEQVRQKALATEADDAIVIAGDWCQFCPALGICPAARQRNLDFFADSVEDDIKWKAFDEFTDEEIVKGLAEADAMAARAKAFQEMAHARVMDGRAIKGLKLVWKRANRKWADRDEAIIELAELGLTKDDIFEEPKMRSPAMLEKHFPGSNKTKRQAAMAHLVEQKPSGTNLVLESDTRPAVNVGASADFEVVDAV